MRKYQQEKIKEGAERQEKISKGQERSGNSTASMERMRSCFLINFDQNIIKSVPRDKI